MYTQPLPLFSPLLLSRWWIVLWVFRSVVLNEGGKEAQLRYGEGYAGMRNLGNSCTS